LVPVTALFVLYFKMAGKLDAFTDTAQTWILRMFVAESAHGVVTYIDQFVANLHTRTLGAVGGAGLIFTAYSLLRTVERSLNDIWKVRRHRSVWERFQMLCSILVLVPTALIASLYLSGRVSELRLLHQVQGITGLMQAAMVFVPFGLTAFSLFMLYKLMPNTSVRFKPALISAMVAAVLFELAKWGFNIYVLRVIPVSKIYGSLGLIPVLLLWIYLCWVIVLFGVELGYSIQNYRELDAALREKSSRHPLSLAVHEEWGLRIVESLARRFVRGEGPQTAERLARDVALPIDAVEDHLGVLTRAEILVAVGSDPRTTYLPRRPLDKMTVAEIASAIRTQLALPPRIDLREERTVLQLIG
jgi:membrane protein